MSTATTESEQQNWAEAVEILKWKLEAVRLRLNKAEEETNRGWATARAAQDTLAEVTRERNLLRAECGELRQEREHLEHRIRDLELRLHR